MALIDLLTRNYLLSPEVCDLQGAISYVVEKLIDDKDDLFNQFNVVSATWGLDKWEKAIGLETDLSKSNEFRRERIYAKLRGRGTTTKQMIIDMARSYSNGEVEVIENPTTYSFKVKFVGTLGIPANMADLIITIEEIKPAHLSYTFEYIYRTHSELGNYTHEQLGAYTHNQLREEAL